MDLAKAFSISTDYKDRKSTPNWETHSFSAVVFIDKSAESAKSMLFQLKDPKISIDPHTIQNATFPFSRDAFIPVGEINVIDRKNKKVYLSNNNTVSYNYLVVASGSKRILSTQEIEFTAGLQALIDALRVKPKIPASFAAYLNIKNPAALEQSRSSNSPSSEQPPINNIVQPQIASANNNQGFELNSISKRLYEVQL